MNGADLKESALTDLESRRSEIVLLARRAFLLHAMRYGTVCADDVQAAMILPPGISPKVFGTVPRLFAKAGVVLLDGVRKSTRPDAHARPVSVWRLINPAAAAEWLSENPEPLTKRLPDRQATLFDNPGGVA